MRLSTAMVTVAGDSSRWLNAILTSECSQLESLKPFDREKMAWGGQSCRLQDLKFRSEVLTCCLNSNLLASTGRSPVPLTKLHSHMATHRLWLVAFVDRTAFMNLFRDRSSMIELHVWKACMKQIEEITHGYLQISRQRATLKWNHCCLPVIRLRD